MIPGPVPGTLALRAAIREDERGGVLRSERSLGQGRGRFERVIPVGPDADTSSLRKEFREGLLILVVPKKAPPREEWAPPRA